jgi:hypothetical protein
MSELVIPLEGAHFGSRFTDRGVSVDAQRLQAGIRTVCEELLETVTIGTGFRVVIHELEEALREAENDQVLPSEHTTALALQFIEAFPSRLAIPDIGIDADGDIFFEWRFAVRRRFNAAVRADGTITYAGIVGTGRFSGEEQFIDEIPAAVLDGFYRALQAASPSAG